MIKKISSTSHTINSKGNLNDPKIDQTIVIDEIKDLFQNKKNRIQNQIISDTIIFPT